ncbi:hypothetical protein WG66_001556 [Moniliophthora roreri]|nr:hypothetical protein WG66_001556 [Moniliophthora roreri]
MPFIQECSDFELHNNHITVVEGSQYNNTQIIHNNQVQVVRQERRKLTIWDEFRRIRMGDIKLIEELGDSNVWVHDHENKNKWKVARRIMSIARVYGSNTDTEFLCAKYSGPGAFKAFKRDFDEYSAIRHLNVAQLFAYNDSQYGLPTLIFYDALIPLGHVLSRSKKVQRALELYFRFQRDIFQKTDGGGFIVTNEIWIEPRSGAIRRGPYVASPYTITGLRNAPSTSCLDPLSIQTYSDTNTVINYLIRILPADIILKSVSDQGKHNQEWLTAVKVWPYLASSLWKRNQWYIIARWTGLARYARTWTIITGGREVVMKDGSVRFQFPDHIYLINSLWLQYECFIDVRTAWLAQAHSVFSQLGIREEEWEEYSLNTRFVLYFSPIQVHTYGEENTDIASNKPTPFLFVRPVPRLSDDETMWRSWAESAKYFWSFDPFGQKEMSESTRVSLGLPSFETQIEVQFTSWDCCAYKLMERLQIFKDFDPVTTDYARSLGYPILEAVGDDDRFQELGEFESNDGLSTSEDKESMAVDHNSPCPDNASHDVIPPPRLDDTPINKIPDAETDEEGTVGNKRKSKSASSGNTRCKFHTDHDDSECGGYRTSKGFDPKMTDHALSLGGSSMQVVGDKDQPQDLEDSVSSTTIADILESYNDLNADDDCTSNEGFESDEEIVLYPRSNGVAAVK